MRSDELRLTHRAMVLAACFAAALPTRAEDLTPVDSALGPMPVQRPATSLKAPLVQPIEVELPETVRPAHLVEPGGEPAAQRDEVGYVDDLAPGTIPHPIWSELPDGGRAWQIQLHSRGARGLRVRWTGRWQPDELELRVYDPYSGLVHGPFKGSPQLETDGWWAPTVFADTVGFEFYLPPGAAIPGAIPTPDQVVFHFPCQCHDGNGPGATLGCHNDIACSSSWQSAEGQAVALIYFLSGGGCFACSGALLARGPADFSPLFMTANHCIRTQAEAGSAEFFWLYETQTCPGGVAGPPPAAYPTPTDGALLLKRDPACDFTLLGLLEPPGTGFYAGWDPNTWASGGTATGVHHPRFSWKRISTGSSAGSEDDVLFCDAAGWVSCGGCAGGVTTCIEVDVWNVSYTSGTTERGSSGSPVFDSARRIRGTLTGGPTGCPTITMRYGRLSDAYSRVKYFLADGDIASPVYVDGAFAGDAGQSGTSERGTSANPFNTVHEATFAVRSGDVVRIDPGSYDEQFTVWRPMTLQRQGPSGTVIIGD